MNLTHSALNSTHKILIPPLSIEFFLVMSVVSIVLHLLLHTHVSVSVGQTLAYATCVLFDVG